MRAVSRVVKRLNPIQEVGVGGGGVGKIPLLLSFSSMTTSLIEVLELLNFGHLTTSTM